MQKEETASARSSGSFSVDLRRLTFHGSEDESGPEAEAVVDREYGKFHKRLSQVGMTPLSRFSDANTIGETSGHEPMDFVQIARRALAAFEAEDRNEQLDDGDCNDARPGPDLSPSLNGHSRRISTIGAGVHQYSFALGRFVAENLNLTSLR